LGKNTLVTEQDPRQSTSPNFVTTKDLRQSASVKNPRHKHQAQMRRDSSTTWKIH